MDRTTHTIIAVAAISIVANYMNTTLNETLLLISGCMNGAMLPDIDQKLNFLKTTKTTKTTKRAKEKTVKHNLIRHRGITHSWVLPLILYSTYMQILEYPRYIFLGILIGVLSHVFIDLLNGNGAEILWPCQKNFSLLDLKYNGIGERVLCALAFVITFISILDINNIKIIDDFKDQLLFVLS